MSYLPGKPENYTLTNVFMENAGFTRPLIEFTEQVMRGPSPFTNLQRETIFAYLSGLNGCQFCQLSHTMVVEVLGGNGNWIKALLSNSYPDDLPGEMKPVLEYARKLNSEIDAISQSDIDTVLEAGWDEVAVVHIVHISGLANFYNRIVSGLGIPADEKIMKPGAKMLAKEGYLGINAALKNV